MCKDYSSSLMASIFELNVIKEEALKKENFMKVYCNCKKIILENYYNALGYLMISLIKHFYRKDIHPECSFDLENIQKDFFEHIYGDLYRKGKVSFIMLSLFELFFKPIETEMFNMIENYLKKIDKNEDKRPIERELLSEIVNYGELVVFYLSSLRVNCQNFSLKLLNEVEYVKERQICKICNCDEKVCVYKGVECPTHKFIEKNGEEIYFYVFPELNDEKFFIPFLEKVKKYHKNYKTIKIVFDFKLFDEYMFNENTEKICEEAIKHFNMVEILNFKINGFFKKISNHPEYLVENEGKNIFIKRKELNK